MAGEQQFYDEQQAEEILRLAVGKSSVSGSISREQLLATAAELGISPEAVAAAEEEHRTQSSERADRARYDKQIRTDFWGHLASYVIVNAGLTGMDLMSDGGLGWAYWSILGWGIGILFHAYETFFRGSEEYEKGFGKWRARHLLRTGRFYALGEGRAAAIDRVQRETNLSKKDAKEVVDELIEESK